MFIWYLQFDINRMSKSGLLMLYHDIDKMLMSILCSSAHSDTCWCHSLKGLGFDMNIACHISMDSFVYLQPFILTASISRKQPMQTPPSPHMPTWGWHISDYGYALDVHQFQLHRALFVVGNLPHLTLSSSSTPSYLNIVRSMHEEYEYKPACQLGAWHSKPSPTKIQKLALYLIFWEIFVKSSIFN